MTSSVTHPTRAMEDYLKCLWRLQERQETVLTGDIATEMAVSPPSVTAMMHRLAEKGLIAHAPYKGAVLTPQGRAIAVAVIRKHRLMETFLHRTLGLDWSAVHDEAERLEHAVSDLVLDRIDALLDYPDTDPHGDAIPDRDGTIRERPLHNLVDCSPSQECTLEAVSGHDPAFFTFLSTSGLDIGVLLTVLRNDPTAGVITLKIAGREPVSLARSAAQKIRVAPRVASPTKT